MTDEADLQLRTQGDPLGMSAEDMLDLPAITTPSLKDLETTTATTTPITADALALSEIEALAQKGKAPALSDALPEWPPSDKFLVEHDDPHGPLGASAIQAKAQKNKLWSHGMTQAAMKVNGRHLSGDGDEWATEALRTTGGIVATIDDDYPYQCHCSKKNTQDMAASGALGSGSASPGSSLAEQEAQSEAAASKFTGVCTHNPSEECMAIPGDHAAVLSVAALALLW